MIVHVHLIDENHLIVPSPYDVPNIKLGLEALEEMANLFLPLYTRKALSLAEKQAASSARSHDAVNAVIINERVSAHPTRGELRPAE